MKRDEFLEKMGIRLDSHHGKAILAIPKEAFQQLVIFVDEGDLLIHVDQEAFVINRDEVGSQGIRIDS